MKRSLWALALFSFFSNWGMAASFYWDADTIAAGNNSTTGSNLGGSGSWDNLATANWWDGASAGDSMWDDSAGKGAIFWGTGGTVTLARPAHGHEPRV
jgi:hypothetical protein